MSGVTPIETRYAGCRFRSRPEARWAVFFGRLGVKWHYEPQGFIIGGRRYLPDFHLPSLGVWAEVKGDERDLDRDLMEAAGMALPGGILILGHIPAPFPDDQDWSWLHLPSGDRVSFGMSVHKQRLWYDFTGGELPDAWTEPAPSEEYGPDMSAAYGAALSARFEWGESP